jgi:ABC-type multidrug transport system ATPase subunit
MFNKSKDCAVRLLNYSHNLNNKELIAPTTLSFPKGRVGILVGKQDSAKSLFLRTLAGHEFGNNGDIVTYGKSLKNSGAEYKRHVFLVSPSIQFNLPCTLAHIPGILMGFYKDWDFVAYRNWLEHMGLPEDFNYSQLSQVMKMRTLVAIAMACGAEVLLFEDVDNYLTTEQQRELMLALQMKAAAGVCALMSSRRLTRWVTSDVDLYSFKGANIIRVDANLLKKRIVGQDTHRPILAAKNGWTQHNLGDENTATMTMTFIAT